LSQSHDHSTLDACRDAQCERLKDLYELVLGTRPSALSTSEALEQLHDALGQIRGFVRRLAEGDLREELNVRGPMAGPLKSLSSSLKHMTWQAKEIAAGDLSQRIDFLGEFSVAFNEMAERLGVTLGELRARERELSDANASLRVAHAQLLDQATHDPLTGLLNRRSLAERWVAETARADRDGEAITVMLADLDKFKTINDECGHECGDTVLVAFAETLNELLRASDVACRMGGDEFVALLPGTRLVGGKATANRIRDHFASADLGGSFNGLQHTASIGLAEYPTHGNTLEDVLRVADRALYRVKAKGRNRVMVAG
jgi:diguanylate cyclase (GGDEF)-like protein